MSLLGYFCTYFHVVERDFNESFIFHRIRMLSPATYMTGSKPSMAEYKKQAAIAFFRVHIVQPKPTYVTQHLCTQ